MESNEVKTTETIKCKGANIYVNCCCPDDGKGKEDDELDVFKGTNVYVDSRNENTIPDGSISNPFKSLIDAFDYVDATSASYIINVINIVDEDCTVDYTFKKQGNLGIVGVWPNIERHIGSAGAMSLRILEPQNKLLIKGLEIKCLSINGTQGLTLDDVTAGEIQLTNVVEFIAINNCRSISGSSSVVSIGYEGQHIGSASLYISNSSVKLNFNNHIYYTYIVNSYVENIGTSLSADAPVPHPFVKIHAHGSIIGCIENADIFHDSLFEFTATQVHKIENYTEGMDLKFHGGDFFLDNVFVPKSYTPERSTLLSNFEAIDKKLAELEARLGA